MTEPITSTMDEVRAAVAELLGEPAERIEPDDNLLDHGLDSMRIMTLAERWQADGVDVDFLRLHQTPTVAAWHALVTGDRR